MGRSFCPSDDAGVAAERFERRVFLEDGRKIFRLLSADAVPEKVGRRQCPIILDLSADNWNITITAKLLPRQIEFSTRCSADRLEALACFPGINDGLQALLANLVF